MNKQNQIAWDLTWHISMCTPHLQLIRSPRLAHLVIYTVEELADWKVYRLRIKIDHAADYSVTISEIMAVMWAGYKYLDWRSQGPILRK